MVFEKFVINYYDEEKTQIKQRYCVDQSGRIQGLYEFFYPNNQLMVKCTYKNDLKQGLYEWFNEDGSVKSKSMYLDGIEQDWHNEPIEKVKNNNIKQIIELNNKLYVKVSPSSDEVRNVESAVVLFLMKSGDVIVGETFDVGPFSYSLKNAITLYQTSLTPDFRILAKHGFTGSFNELGTVCFCNDLVKELYTCNRQSWPMFRETNDK